MRRTWGTGSITHRPDGRWEARLRGQSYYLHSRRDAEAKLNELLGLIQRGVMPTSESLTVGAWLEQWLAVQRPAIRVGTYQRYEQIVRLQLLPHLGPERLNRLRPAQVSAMMTSLADEGMKASTIQQVRAVLKAALNAAVADSKLVRNVAQIARAPRVEDSTPFAPTPELARALVDAAGAYSDELRRAVVFGINTGLRAGEQAALRWSDVNLEAGFLVVGHSLTRTYGEAGGWELTAPKTFRSRRRVDLAPSVVAVLLAERDSQTEVVGPIPDLVFRDADGNPRVQDPRRLQAALKHAGLLFRADTGKALTWDAVCREGHASLLLQQGNNLAEVSKRLGHSSVVITARHYGGITDASQVRLGSSLEALRIA